MKAILYIATIIVAIAAIFFTFGHSRKFEALQKDRLQTIAENKKVSADSSVKEKEVSDEKIVLDASKLKRDEVTQSVVSLESSGATLKRESTDLDGMLKTQETELAELNNTLEEVKKIVANLGTDVTIDNLGDKIQEIEADKTSKQTKLEETQTLIGAAEKSLASNRAEADRFAKRLIERNARIGRNSMEAVVTAVNQEWGFLVIGAGSNSGFTPQTSLLVMRDGRLIGRVRPSAIEPNQTIAEIDLKSLAPGVRLQPGDRVMLTKPSTN
jgi:hypothetical protein